MTRKTTYALRALCRLGADPANRPTLADDIATSEGIPRRFLDVILRQLAREGVLTSTRGPRGGYTLRARPEELRIAAVVRALDGPAFPFPCLHETLPARCAECPGDGPCPARIALREVGFAAFQVLEDMTLADLIRKVSALSSSTPETARSARLETSAARK